MISFSVIAHFLAVASPGPDTLIIIRQSLNYGRRGGFLTALGIGCGILIHSYLAIFGISSLIFQFDFIKDIIIVFGSVYLIYLGLLSIFDNSELQDKNTNSKNNSFLVGLVTNILNLKAFIFFVSIFGIISSEINLYYMHLLAIYFSIATFIWFYILSVMLSVENVRRRYLSYSFVLNKCIGFVFIFISFLILFNYYGY
tara:strand:+ start:542 stop:1138 length:597 start_codon:yes stop_codon:yes gene_type:complete